MAELLALQSPTLGLPSTPAIEFLFILSACVGVVQLVLAILLAVGDPLARRITAGTPAGQLLLGASNLCLATALLIGGWSGPLMIVFTFAFLVLVSAGLRVESTRRRARTLANPLAGERGQPHRAVE